MASQHLHRHRMVHPKRISVLIKSARLPHSKNSPGYSNGRWRFVAIGFWGLLASLIVACGGGNDPAQTTPLSPIPMDQTQETIPTIDPMSQSSDTSGFAMPRGVQATDNLSVLATNYFVHDGRVYVVVVVRNDSESIIGTIKASLNFIDADDLRLSTQNLSTAFTNIQPGQVVVLQGDYLLPDFFDGISALVYTEESAFDSFIPHLDAATETEFIASERLIRGSATNTSPDPLILPVAYFLLYGASENDILAAIPAQPTSGLDAESMWQPGTLLHYNVSVIALPSENISAVREVQLMVVAYTLAP